MTKFVLMITAILASLAHAGGTDAETTLARYYEAAGGLEQIKAINTYYKKGSFRLADTDFDFPLVEHEKRPNKKRQSMKAPVGEVIESFDGEVAWVINPVGGSDKPVLLPKKQAEARKKIPFDGVLVAWQEMGFTIRAAAETTLESAPHRVVDFTRASGSRVRAYFDKRTDLPSRIESYRANGQLSTSVVLDDFRTVGPILRAFHITVQDAEGAMVRETRYETIDVGLDIDDAFFSLPEERPQSDQPEGR